jgi:DNA-binding PadR family transcriptional regulator
MKIDEFRALAKILEYLVMLREEDKNGTTLYRITRKAFTGLTTQRESRIKAILGNLILKDYVSLTKMADDREYYSITQNGIDFYKNKVKAVIETLISPNQPSNHYD